MKAVYTTFVALHFLGTSLAAYTCNKDACYNVVASSGGGKPGLASRKADCSSILQRFDDQQVLATVTTTLTTSLTTTQTSTETSTATLTSTQGSDGKRSIVERYGAGVAEMMARLDARDNVVISGKKPSYAGACKKDEDYAVACLCYGVKANVQRTITKTMVITSVQTSTSTSQTTTTTTTTAIEEVACSDDLNTDINNCGACNNKCETGQRCQAGTCVFDQCRVTRPGGDQCVTFRGCPELDTDECNQYGSCFSTVVGNRCMKLGCENACPNGQSDCEDDRVCATDTCCGSGSFCMLPFRCPTLGFEPDMMRVEGFSRIASGFGGGSYKNATAGRI